MALTVYTDDPAGLLADIKKAVDDGHIDTWSYDNEGDFTHTPSQWIHKAWLRPTVVQGAIVFSILRHRDFTVTVEVYAVYHGRFLEALLAHFDQRFATATATALARAPDVVK